MKKKERLYQDRYYLWQRCMELCFSIITLRLVWESWSFNSLWYFFLVSTFWLLWSWINFGRSWNWLLITCKQVNIFFILLWCFFLGLQRNKLLQDDATFITTNHYLIQDSKWDNHVNISPSFCNIYIQHQLLQTYCKGSYPTANKKTKMEIWILLLWI